MSCRRNSRTVSAMSYLNLELQAQERVADRLRKAEQERLVWAARHAPTRGRTRNPIFATAAAVTRLLSSVL
jgi:hypothetical protein